MFSFPSFAVFQSASSLAECARDRGWAVDDWRDRVRLSSFFVGSWRPDGWEVPRPRGNTKRAEGHPVFSGAGWLNNEVSAGMVAGEGSLELSGGF